MNGVLIKSQLQYKTSHSQLWAMLDKDAGRLFYPPAVKTLLPTQGWSGSSLSDQTWSQPIAFGARQLLSFDARLNFALFRLHLLIHLRPSCCY